MLFYCAAPAVQVLMLTWPDTCRWEAKGPENMVFAVSAEVFDEIIGHGKTAGQLVVVKFFAPWCQACKALYPKFIQIAEHNPDVTFIKVCKQEATFSKEYQVLLSFWHQTCT